jgi:tripartite-type tricarboxylate transporter receptor subunit TctC
MRRLFSILTLIAVLLGTGAARADDLRIVVPFAAGGPTDAVARALAVRLKDLLGDTVIVDNRAGAGGIIGTQAVASAPPNGNTVILSTLGSQVISAAINGRTPYHPATSFDPIVLVGKLQIVLVVRKDHPAQTLTELIAMGRSRQLNYGSAGTGTTTHIAAEIMNAEAGANATHIPYRGGAPALLDLIAGNVDFFVGDVSTVLAQIQAGQVRPLAVFDAARARQVPNVPTTAELGYPGMVMSNWYGVLAPAGLQPAVRDRLERAFLEAIRTPSIAARLAELGIDGPLGAADFRSVLGEDARRWPATIQRMGIREN